VGREIALNGTTIVAPVAKCPAACRGSMWTHRSNGLRGGKIKRAAVCSVGQCCFVSGVSMLCCYYYSRFQKGWRASRNERRNSSIARPSFGLLNNQSIGS
jgi:hypothetical protein